MKARLIFRLTKGVVKLYCSFFMKVRVHGLNNVARRTGAIIVANHRSHLDGFLLYSFMSRMIYSFIKSDYFKNPFLRWYLKGGGGIPVKKGALRLSSIRQAQRVLREGNVLLMFPEGQINEGEGLLPFENTFLRLALKCRVPVVPTAIVGTQNAFPDGQWLPRPCEVVVVFQQPFLFESQEGAEGSIDSHVERLRKVIAQTVTSIEAANTGPLVAEHHQA